MQTVIFRSTGGLCRQFIPRYGESVEFEFWEDYFSFEVLGVCVDRTLFHLCYSELMGFEVWEDNFGSIRGLCRHVWFSRIYLIEVFKDGDASFHPLWQWNLRSVKTT